MATNRNAPALAVLLAAVLTVPAAPVAARRMERRMGLTGEPYSQGTAGRWMSVAEALTAAGVVATLAVGGRSRRAAVLPGVALLAASLCTRFGVFAAGMQSAQDPRCTVVPQRERLDVRTRADGERRAT